MQRSGECLRQKQLIGHLRWIINFLISEVKQYEETMGNEQSQIGSGGYQIDEITYVKVGNTLYAYMCAQGGMWEGSKSR